MYVKAIGKKTVSAKTLRNSHRKTVLAVGMKDAI